VHSLRSDAADVLGASGLTAFACVDEGKKDEGGPGARLWLEPLQLPATAVARGGAGGPPQQPGPHAHVAITSSRGPGTSSAQQQQQHTSDGKLNTVVLTNVHPLSPRISSALLVAAVHADNRLVITEIDVHLA